LPCFRGETTIQQQSNPSSNSIKLIQSALNQVGISCNESESFDDETVAAVKIYQSCHDLELTGDIDQLTIQWLDYDISSI
jgi:murein L,D-transpeptidase YcbB/YkuD